MPELLLFSEKCDIFQLQISQATYYKYQNTDLQNFIINILLKGKFVTAAQRSLTPLQYFGTVREFCAIVLSLTQLHLSIKSHFCYFSVVLSWGMTDSALHHSAVWEKEISYPLYWSVNFSSDWAHISILPESRSDKIIVHHMGLK